MRWLVTAAACLAPAIYSANVPLFAQLQDNNEKQMTCDNGGNNGDRARHCEIREQTAPGVGRLDVDAGGNGGVTVKGWLRSAVLVRTRVETWGDTAADAAARASQVVVDSSGGQVHAMAPDSNRDSSWSVSYEIFVPQNGDLALKAHNGGLTISDVHGAIHFESSNGGVHLKRVAGDVSGSTVNGGIQVELAGAMFDGRQLEVRTTNGGVTVTMPTNYSAHLQAETQQGGIQSDFPITMGNLRSRRLDANVGAGGALIHVTTENGGVHFKRTETQ